MKTKRISRMVSVILCIALIFSVAVQGIGVTSAASEIDVNFIGNSDFEDSNAFDSQGYENCWHLYREVAQTDTEHHSGSHSGAITAQNSSFEQKLPNLVVGTTYRASVWAKRTDTGAGQVVIGVKNYGGDEKQFAIDSNEWKEYTYEFTVSSSTDVTTVFAWANESATSAQAYIDDYKLTVVGGIQHASVDNGSLDITLDSSYNGTPSVSEFSAVYFTDADSTSKPLELKQASVNDKNISFTFDEIPATALDQLVTVDVSINHGSVKQTVRLDFTVPADGTQVVEAEMKSVTAENGRVTVLLDTAPTRAPKSSDFTFTMSINGNEATAMSVTNFSYDSESMTVTADFDRVSSIPNEDREVTITATYREKSMSGTFTVEAGTSTTYYIAANGSDSNDGISENTPFQTLDKINQINLAPGDTVLFRRGDTFVGVFKPKGSGVDGAPIVVKSYGEGAAPIIKEDANGAWSAVLMKGNEGNQILNLNVSVNGSIYLENVEYYEISDLELEGVTYAQHQSENNLDYISTYSSGIRLVNKNMGDLSHFYFENLVIHGFRGPTINNGKTSGGINMNVLIDRNNASENVKSTFVDIKVNNCEIYECGRSGINFLSPWARRTEEKWSTINYGVTQYPRYPVKGFVLSNSLIHDIDGDGLIVDNVDNAVVEHNLCYRTSQRIGSGFPASVGFFNWNSDNTIFQYNEVYQVGVDAISYNGSKGTPPDAQGIEIDAINDTTWVQYNYLHDNAGGVMLWCSHNPIYIGYGGIARYNIFENNYTARDDTVLFTIGSYAYDSEFYNNVVYLSGESCLKNGKINWATNDNVNSTYKLYNNIFIYDGEEKEINNLTNNAVDWRSNIFFGISNMPTDDDPDHPNIKGDPMLVSPNSAETGKVPGELPDLSGYKTKEGSPAVHAGIVIESMKDKAFNGDFFGNLLTDKPDIGIYESEGTAPTPPSPPTPPTPDVMLGDANGDEVVDTLDATTVLQKVAEIIKDGDEGYNAECADVTFDGVVDTSDATAILQKIAGIITEFTKD